MELIKLATSRRSRLSDVLHNTLNITYAAMLFMLVLPGVDLPYLAFLLVLLSKWRVIAVRPRFWFANLQANLVDFIMGISTVALMILTVPTTPFVAATIAALFAFWLVVIKPHSSKRFVLMQAGITQFVALTALFSYAHLFEFRPLVTDTTFLTVVIAWLIGYVIARHALSAFRDEDERAFLSLVWGLIVAQLAWLYHHWTIAYSIYSQAGTASDKQLMIPQVAIVIGLISFVIVRLYGILHHETVTKKDVQSVRSAAIFSSIVVALLLIFFNGSLDLTRL